VGDFVLTLPALRLLRHGFPKASLSVLGYPSIARLALLSGDADEVHSLEHGSMAPLFAPVAQIDPALGRFFSGFQLIVSWLYDPDGIFRNNLSRCGVKTVLQGEHRVDFSTNLPAAAQLAKPLEQLALYLEAPFLTFPFPPGKSDEAAASPTIAIHPGSGSPRKNWGYENWALTAEKLQERLPGIQFRIVSGEAEEETIGHFLDLLRKSGIERIVHERQNLCDLAGALSTCALFLGHDSGVSHLAAATGIRCGLLFGPTDPRIWAPQNPSVRVLRKPSGSLSQISPEEVTALALDLLAG
jgi:heptosyltransferase III